MAEKRKIDIEIGATNTASTALNNALSDVKRLQAEMQKPIPPLGTFAAGQAAASRVGRLQAAVGLGEGLQGMESEAAAGAIRETEYRRRKMAAWQAELAEGKARREEQASLAGADAAGMGGDTAAARGRGILARGGPLRRGLTMMGSQMGVPLAPELGLINSVVEGAGKLALPLGVAAGAAVALGLGFKAASNGVEETTRWLKAWSATLEGSKDIFDRIAGFRGREPETPEQGTARAIQTQIDAIKAAEGPGFWSKILTYESRSNRGSLGQHEELQAQALKNMGIAQRALGKGQVEKAAAADQEAAAELFDLQVEEDARIVEANRKAQAQEAKDREAYIREDEAREAGRRAVREGMTEDRIRLDETESDAARMILEARRDFEIEEAKGTGESVEAIRLRFAVSMRDLLAGQGQEDYARYEAEGEAVLALKDREGMAGPGGIGAFESRMLREGPGSQGRSDPVVKELVNVREETKATRTAMEKMAEALALLGTGAMFIRLAGRS